MRWHDILVEYGNEVLEGTGFTIKPFQTSHALMVVTCNGKSYRFIIIGRKLWINGNGIDLNHPNMLEQYKEALWEVVNNRNWG